MVILAQRVVILAIKWSFWSKVVILSHKVVILVQKRVILVHKVVILVQGGHSGPRSGHSWSFLGYSGLPWAGVTTLGYLGLTTRSPPVSMN